MKYIIGIDIGTGSTKAVAVTLSGKPVESTQKAYPTYAPEQTYSEQAPEMIWQAFVKSLLELINIMKSAPDGIVLSSAMHSVIPVDEKGNALMNMITWADNRSATIAKQLRKTPEGEEIYTRTGTPIHAMTPVCKLQWLRENTPALFTATHKFISIKEYIWFKLFGVFEVDYSIASATGLFDLATLRWNETALTFCSVAAQKLSLPVEVTHTRTLLTASESNVSLNALQGIPILIGGSDGCMANLGSFAVTPGVAALTIGTSGAIRVANTRPTVNFRAMTFNYLLTKDIFISGGPINNGGVVLKWYAEIFLRKSLDTAADYDALLAEVKSIKPGAEGLIFLPFILGERAPLWDSEASGVFFGIRNYHTQAHFTRAVIEGVSLALYSIANAMESSGLAIEEIHVSGGFVHSEEWLQILADIFGKKICLINAEDASAVGAAYLGMRALNLIEDYYDLRPKREVEYLPLEQNNKVYQKVFSIYESLYKKLMPDMENVATLRS
jgi:gluconokinase